MIEVKAILVSRGKEGPKGRRRESMRAEVRVVGLSSEFGFTGPERIMSINRHLQQVYASTGVGNNPNYLVPGMNDAAEKRLADAKLDLENCKRKLAELESDLKTFEQDNRNRPVPLVGLEIVEAKDIIRQKIAKAEVRLAEAEEDVPAAEQHLAKIQEEFPRLVRFLF